LLPFPLAISILVWIKMLLNDVKCHKGRVRRAPCDMRGSVEVGVCESTSGQFIHYVCMSTCIIRSGQFYVCDHLMLSVASPHAAPGRQAKNQHCPTPHGAWPSCTLKTTPSAYYSYAARSRRLRARLLHGWHIVARSNDYR